MQVGQGSLLEDEAQFAYDTEVTKSFAKFPHQLAGAAADYQATTAMYHSDLFGFQEKSLASHQIADTTIAGVSSAVGSATKVAQQRRYSSLAAQNSQGSALDV